MRNILIAVFAVVLVCSMANAQWTTQGAAAYYYVSTVGAVTVAASASGEIINLSPGYTYTVNPDPNFDPGDPGMAITPMITGSEEVSAIMNFTVASDVGGAIVVTFDLPTQLVGSGEGDYGFNGGVIPCTFSPTSLYVDPGGVLLNPNVPNTLNTTSAVPELNLYLGITVTVPPGTVPDKYRGVVTCTAAVSGF